MTLPSNGEDLEPVSLCGFGPSDIFAVGSQQTQPYDQAASLILHFNGSQWTEYPVEGSYLRSVRGTGPTNVWAGGWLGTLFHFDGVKWNKINAGSTLCYYDFAFWDGKTYALAYTLDEQPLDSTWYYFLSWNGEAWDTPNSYLTIRDQGQPPFRIGSLTTIDGKLYSSGSNLSDGPMVFEYTGKAWNVVFSGNPGIAKIFGTDRNNIWGVSASGTLYHYDGNRWKLLSQLRSSVFDYWTGWTDGKEVFVVGYGLGDWPQKSIVLHGK